MQAARRDQTIQIPIIKRAGGQTSIKAGLLLLHKGSHRMPPIKAECYVRAFNIWTRLAGWFGLVGGVDTCESDPLKK